MDSFERVRKGFDELLEITNGWEEGEVRIRALLRGAPDLERYLETVKEMFEEGDGKGERGSCLEA
jgi:hypothetical protein